MTKAKYAIRKMYDFSGMCDGARPSSASGTAMQVKLTHEEAIELGEFFYDEDPSELDDCGFGAGYKEALDERYARRHGWNALDDVIFYWSDDLKEDCIAYFKAHTTRDLDAELENI